MRSLETGTRLGAAGEDSPDLMTERRRTRSAPVAVFMAAFALLLLPAAASASSVSVNATALSYAGDAVPNHVTISLGTLTTYVIDGSLGDDATATVNGGSGGDTFTGQAATETFNGDGGGDTLRGGTASDSLDGGPDTDTATYDERAATEPVTVTLDDDATRNDGGAEDGTAGNRDVVAESMVRARC